MASTPGPKLPSLHIPLDASMPIRPKDFSKPNAKKEYNFVFGTVGSSTVTKDPRPSNGPWERKVKLVSRGGSAAVSACVSGGKETLLLTTSSFLPHHVYEVILSAGGIFLLWCPWGRQTACMRCSEICRQSEWGAPEICRQLEFGATEIEKQPLCCAPETACGAPEILYVDTMHIVPLRYWYADSLHVAPLI